MLKSKLLSVLSISLLLAGCGGTTSSSENTSSDTSIDVSSISDDEVNFTARNMDAYVYDFQNMTSIEVYFRDGGLENIPYITLSNYYKHLLNEDLVITETNDGVFKVQSHSGEAIIDTVNDVLTSDDYEKFINTTFYRQDDALNTYFDGAPFVRLKETVYESAVQSTTINFKEKYHIDLFKHDGDILLPFVTASNMFMGPTMLTGFYSKECVYFVDPNDLEYDTSYMIYYGDRYLSSLGGFYENGKRSQEQAELSYYELCFLIDTYYGRPGRETLHNTLMTKGSLDEALLEHDKFTKIARTYLQSEDQAEYFAGLMILDDYLSDAGHSAISSGLYSFYNCGNYEAYSAAIAKIKEAGYQLGSASAARNTDAAYINGLTSAISSANIQNNQYIVKGDTILFTFNSFMFDIEGWKDYYAGKVSRPIDTISTLKDLLDEYEGGTTIKNFVLDISHNGGGFGDMVFTIMGLMGKSSYIHYKDIINQNYVTSYYEIDKNFDGKFDELDNEVNYHYNFGILSSAYSFSCGNMLPNVAKENGIMLLGDKSGGGCCAVLDTCNTEGLYVRLSSQIHMVTKTNEEIEMGVTPHEYLVSKNGSDYDFSKFFDLDVISEKMNAFYAE